MKGLAKVLSALFKDLSGNGGISKKRRLWLDRSNAKIGPVDPEQCR
jgi:hypothetical protein